MWWRYSLAVLGWSLFWIIVIAGGYLLWREAIVMNRIIP